MTKILVIICLITLFALRVSAQEIKAKNAHNYIGKTATITGKIKAVAGPGYLSSMSFYLVTDSVEVGIDVIIPMRVWRKSKIFNVNQKGKTMRVTGLIGLNGEPYTEVKNLRDVEILE